MLKSVGENRDVTLIFKDSGSGPMLYNDMNFSLSLSLSYSTYGILKNSYIVCHSTKLEYCIFSVLSFIGEYNLTVALMYCNKKNMNNLMGNNVTLFIMVDMAGKYCQELNSSAVGSQINVAVWYRIS